MSVILKINDVTDAIHICEALVAEAERIEDSHPTKAKRYQSISESISDALDRLPESTFKADRAARLVPAVRLPERPRRTG